ncbi:nucleotidyltransferase family protein [Virgibacillus halophilus]|uniref:Nucleotidyltransferase family protein n=1 Tax=Tigheibacillus halophilus TaxID=361280 RepID=A0ABU5CA17_9BACI|nr:nucleotidyltransferase family protein [Virgibacillus halophilus]
MNEGDLVELIEEDEWMMEILRAAQVLLLPDWWICAGFVRSKIWDVLHKHRERTPIPNIDVIYFNSQNMVEREEKAYERKLHSILPSIPWSVKNEARMHMRNKVSPYSSSVDAIAKFPETATALGVKLEKGDNVVLAAPYGISDAVNLKVKPTPFFYQNRGTDENL